MFFDDEILIKRKAAQLRALPPVPETGWRPPAFPNLDAACAISFDVETYDPGLTEAGPGWARGKGHIVGISIGAQSRCGSVWAGYFPIRHTVEPEYNLPVQGTLKFVADTLARPCPKVGANLLYDIGWLSEEGISVAGELSDVQFAEALLDEEARVALDALGLKYLREGKDTNILYDWIVRAYSPGKTEIRASIYRSPPCLVGPYATSDAALPLRVMQCQWQELQRQELTDLFRLECDLIPLLVRMRREGVTVDVNKAVRMKEELENETEQLYAQLSSTYGLSIESCSTANLERLFTHVGIDAPKTASGKGQFRKEWLRDLAHPIGAQINNIREHEKICGTFLQSYVIEKNVNGKLYPQFHPLKGDKNGTQVGRLSSSDPNLQNLPSRTKLGKKVRTIFTPDTSHSHWIKLDYSQVHYRELAHFAVDGAVDFNRVQAFWRGELIQWGGDGSSDALRARYCNDPDTDYHMDVFNNVAPFMGWDVNDPEIIKEKRRPIKNVNFGLLYGQSEKSLAYKAGMTVQQAKEFFEFYHKGAPYVRSTMKAIGFEVQQFGYIRTLLGRRCRFNLWEPQGFGERGLPLPYDAAIRQYGPNIRRAYEYRGVNYKLQGSEPDIMKTGMRDCLRSGVFDYVGVPRLTVHDELDFSVRDNSPQTQEAFEFVKHTMQNAIKLRVPVKVDVSTGPNWGECD